MKERKDAETELLRMFSSFAHLHSGALNKLVTMWHPPTDVYQTDDRLVVLSEIAGLTVDDIHISLEGNLLKIFGERSEKQKDKRATFQNMEINYGPFERNIQIPPAFTGGDINVLYSNGFLRIEISKGPSLNIKIKID